MAAYFSKSEQEMSKALRQTEKEIQSQKLKNKEAMYKLVYAFVNVWQVSVQEAAYLWLTYG